MTSPQQCSLVRVERRINDARLLRMEVEKHYFNPDRFRLNLNSCITALRSVTFVLQKGKTDITEFDTWYERWRGVMRTNPTLKWLIDSRNKIEKEGDLVTNSRARIGIYNSWSKPPMVEFDVPPSIKTSDLAHILAKTVPEPLILEGNLLKLERRWIDSELKERELLGLIDEGYAAINSVLIDAHAHLKKPCHCDWLACHQQQEVAQDFSVGNDSRTVWLNLEDFSEVEMESQQVPITKESLESAQSRYNFPSDLVVPFDTKTEFRTQVIRWFEIAKLALKREGFHLPIALLTLPNTLEVIQLKMETRAQKHLAIRKVAETAKAKKASRVVLINEAWVANFDPNAPQRYAKNAPNRREALVVHAVDVSGNCHNCFVVFEKHEGQVVFMGSEEHDEVMPPILQPFIDAWASTSE